jgi:hypothetical protein
MNPEATTGALPALPAISKYSPAESRLFAPFFFYARAQFHHRAVHGRRNARIVSTSTSFAARFGRKEMLRNPGDANHRDEAEDQQSNGIVRIHQLLFSASPRDVKAVGGI